MKREIKCGGYTTSRIFISYDQTTMQMQSVGRSRSATPKNLANINSISEIREQLFSNLMGLTFLVLQKVFLKWNRGIILSNFTVLPQKTLALQRALFAIYCVYVGGLNNDDRLSHHGIQLYTSLMQSVAKMLCTKTHTEDSLYATVIFKCSR